MSERDGGPAFPVDLMDVDSMGEMKVRYQEPGMSLRDWFAGKALAQMYCYIADRPSPSSYAAQARTAYAVADAMLAAREAE